MTKQLNCTCYSNLTQVDYQLSVASASQVTQLVAFRGNSLELWSRPMFQAMKKALGFRPDYMDIKEAYDAGDYGVVFAYYKTLTERSDASATHVLANLYKKGVGTQVDSRKYQELIKRSAELGHIEAKWEYVDDLTNESVPQNVEEIERHLIDIGESNDDSAAKAWQCLARIFGNDNGVPVDVNKSVIYYQKAAELGDVEAINSLGVIFRDGEKVQRNSKDAAAYFQIGSDKFGNSDSQIFLGLMYKDGEGVPKSIDKAIELFVWAADQENSLAMHLLAQIYRDDNSKKNLVLAYKWMNLAAMELDYLREHRDLLEEEMDGEQIKLSQLLCNEWCTIHSLI